MLLRIRRTVHQFSSFSLFLDVLERGPNRQHLPPGFAERDRVHKHTAPEEEHGEFVWQVYTKKSVDLSVAIDFRVIENAL